jgi:copper chaperone
MEFLLESGAAGGANAVPVRCAMQGHRPRTVRLELRQAGAAPFAQEFRAKEKIMIELTLPTMTCGHCVKAVTATVQQVDAAAQVQIDLPLHKLCIESALPAEVFERALAEEGYVKA